MTVADYQVLRDSNVELGEDIQEVVRLQFDLPNDFVVGTSRAKPILMYRVTSRGDVRYVFSVNDPGDDQNIPQNRIQEAVTLDANIIRSLHEPIQGDLLNPGVRNWIDLRVVRGSAIFGDIVLLYQRDV